MPGGQFIVGLLSALYIFLPNEPWVLLPINAAIHALSGVLCYLILNMIGAGALPSLLSSMLLVAFPSTLVWTSQIHRDGIYLFSVLLIFYSYFRVNRDVYRSGMYLILGIVLLALTRVYMLSILPHAILASIIVVFVWFLLFQNQSGSVPKGIGRKIIWATMLITLSFFAMNYVSKYSPSQGVIDDMTRSMVNSSIKGWQSSEYIPDIVENKVMGLVGVRNNFIRAHSDAGSNIDTDIQFSGMGHIVEYAPRALLIALFSPFPDMWISDARSEGGNIMRKAAGLEMLVVYAGMLCFAVFFYKIRKNRFDVLVLTMFCISLMVVLAYAVPNIGTLHRMRYAFIMLPVMTGFALLLSALTDSE